MYSQHSSDKSEDYFNQQTQSYWNDQYKERAEEDSRANGNTAGHTPVDTPSVDAAPVESATLSHVNEAGKANMVDVSPKSPTERRATAYGRVYLGATAFNLVRMNHISKGDVLSAARLAGVMGAKKTSDLIPLCHNIPISKVSIEFDLIRDEFAVDIYSEVKTVHVTGVEMEALTAASVAALTIYDMCKSVTHTISLTDFKLLSKTGGKTDYKASN